MIKKSRIISFILLVSITALSIPKTLPTYADSSELNYDSKYDLNNDSIINELDIDEISKYYNTEKDNPNWNSKFDFNNDGFIDILDIIKISKLEGTSYVKKSSAKALTLQNLLASNNNVTITKDESGKSIYNVWVKGITPPNESDFTNISHSDGEYNLKVLPWKFGQGWYDINKILDGLDNHLCSGAIVTNMLHWWLEQNKDYVDRYLAENPENGKTIDKQYDLRTSSTFHDQKNSDIFNLIKNCFRGKSLWADKALLWYISGFDMNLPRGFQYTSPTFDDRGGFFKDVFKEPGLTDSSYVDQYDDFNSKLLESLQEDKVFGISHKTIARYNHIITLWGASFDEDGKLLGIYTTDSDDTNYEISKGVPYGMKYFRVLKDSSGLGRLTVYTGNDNTDIGAKTVKLYSLSLEKDQWEKYFNKNNNN